MKSAFFLLILILAVINGSPVSADTVTAQQIEGSGEVQLAFSGVYTLPSQPQSPARQRQQLENRQERRGAQLHDQQASRQRTLGLIQPRLEERRDRRQSQLEAQQERQRQQIGRQQTREVTQLVNRMDGQQQTLGRLQSRLEEEQDRQQQQIESRQVRQQQQQGGQLEQRQQQALDQQQLLP